LLGISSISNLLSAIKTAKWYELDENDILFTVFTDSMEMYGSRMDEAEQEHGPYSAGRAEIDFHLHLQGLKTDNMAELGHWDRKRVHNLKYYTWIEQQQKELDELNAQWEQHKTYWPKRFGKAAEYDELIEAFNKRTGLLEKYK